MARRETSGLGRHICQHVGCRMQTLPPVGLVADHAATRKSAKYADFTDACIFNPPWWKTWARSAQLRKLRDKSASCTFCWAVSRTASDSIQLTNYQRTSGVWSASSIRRSRLTCDRRTNSSSRLANFINRRTVIDDWLTSWFRVGSSCRMCTRGSRSTVNDKS